VTSPRVDRGIGIGISTGLSAICISFVQNSIIFFIFIILYFMCFEGIRSMRNEDILSLPWGRVTENTGPNPCLREEVRPVKSEIAIYDFRNFNLYKVRKFMV
jgi:hypothetical protein